MNSLKVMAENKHWITLLADYEEHVLKSLLLEFDYNVTGFLFSSYIYFGKLKKKDIIIIHFHSELPGLVKFMDIQNFDSYKKIKNISVAESKKIALEISRETVISLGINNALSRYHLKKIEKIGSIYLCNEKGELIKHGNDF